MEKQMPDEKTLRALMGQEKYAAFAAAAAMIEDSYEMETLWGPGGKAGPYELKYRRGGKTLCAFYPRENSFGFMMIFGRAEREKFEAMREEFSAETQRVYDEAHTYRDGKWVMFESPAEEHLAEMKRLLAIKRRPNRK
ncbi:MULTISPECIES: DUF3788 domain-containing protein [unclassified Clostridium]|uniref:DUF3788 domain-containing protein n=1 Tax=unclassified Clostridium TaxID=2614128 RepID=UPI0011075468|nr:MULTISPECIES: DUF3788 domain-containing protein [unclassified Clostridium]